MHGQQFGSGSETMAVLYWIEFVRKSDGKINKTTPFCSGEHAREYLDLVLLKGLPARLMKAMYSNVENNFDTVSEVYRSDSWTSYEIQKIDEFPNKTDASPETRKKELLDKIAKLMEEYEDPTGNNCSNDSMAEIWFEDGKERYLFNGERFTKINPHWFAFKRYGENVVHYGQELIKASEEKNLTELDRWIGFLHSLVEEIRQSKENGYSMEEDIYDRR
jgi:hypothetical protein